MAKIATEGYHDVTVAQALVGESANGVPQLCLVLVGADGANIRAYRYFSTKVGQDGKSAAQRSVAEIKAAFPSWNGDFTAITETGLLLALEGMECNIKVEAEEYKCKTQHRVSFINAPGGSSKAKALADKSILRKLSAMAGFAASPVGAATPATPASTPAVAAPADDQGAADEDVPF